MKRLVKILLLLVIIISINSCSNSSNVIDEVLKIESGAILRTIEVVSNTLNSSDSSTQFSVIVEEQDAEDGDLLKSVSIYVSIKDLSPDNGITVVNDMLIKTIDASAFSTGPHGLPRGTLSATFGEAIAAMGLGVNDHAPGDLFIFELRLGLTDGRVFGAAEAGSSVTGGFFSAPHKYNALILCSPESGVYTIEMHDTFGDGWQTDDPNGGSGIQVTIDGVVTEIGMCSPYLASDFSCTPWSASITDPTSEYTDATATVTIPAGTQEATWFFPGDQYGEISFEVYAPNGDLAFASGGSGDFGSGLIPVSVCASN